MRAEKVELDEDELKLYGSEIAGNVLSDEVRVEAEGRAKKVLESAVFNLDAALDSYDPTFPRYTPSEEAFEFFNLMRLVQGSDFEFSTPIVHYFMADLLLGHITDKMVFPYSEEVCRTIELDELRLGFMASRGLAKSTLVISFFGVYSAIKGKLTRFGSVYFYLVLAASSRGGARVNALAVRAMCEDSLFLKDYFEDMRFTESESEFVRKDLTGKVAKKDRSFLIRYQGINTGVRGSRYGERRPDCILLDDAILNTAAAYSKVLSENLEDIIHSDSVNALKGGGRGRVMLCFTPFHYGDVNTKALLQGAFTQVVLPLSSAFDAGKDVMMDDIQSSWEAMHPAGSIKKLIVSAKKAEKIGEFMQERMLRLSSSSDRLIPDSCIQWYDSKMIADNIHAYNVYITTDYTTTSGEKSDFSGIATWAVSNNEDWFLLNLTLRKRTMEAQYMETLREAAKWTRRGKYVEIGVEVDGNQSAHVYSLERLMAKQGTWYSFAKQKGDPNSTRKGILSRGTGVVKHERFRIASQLFRQKKVWFPNDFKDTPDMIEFLAQVRGATHSSFTRADDGPDLCSMAFVSMEVVYPTADAEEYEPFEQVSGKYWGKWEHDKEDSGSSVIF